MSDQPIPEFVILRGLARQKHRPIHGPAFLIGRASDCDLVLGDPQFADVHACVLMCRGGLWIRHLGFSPEITVNGQPINRMQLLDGDRIRTGPYEFQLQIEKPARRNLTCQPVATLPGSSLLGRGLSTADQAIAAVRELIAEVRADVIGEPQTLRLFGDREPGQHLSGIASATLPASSIPNARQVRRA